MLISSVSWTGSLLNRLEANGLSASKAKLVETALNAAEMATPASIGSASATVTSAAVRAALDTTIDADVSSGKLSVSDAALVKKTLDGIDGGVTGSSTTSQATTSKADTASTGSSASAGSPGPDGGSGGGSSKTELSDTVTITGSIKTTLITYTDNTTSTNTTTATASDKAKYDKSISANTGSEVAQKYLSAIEPGSLINLTA